MAVRTAYDAVASTVLTAANLDKYPGGWIGYAERTTSQTGIGTSLTDITSLTVTVTAGTSRRLKVQGYGRAIQNTSAGLVEIFIRDGANAQLNHTSISHTAAATHGMHQPCSVQTPGSGENTYKLGGSTSANTFDFYADSTQPSFILVSDLGPAS